MGCFGGRKGILLSDRGMRQNKVLEAAFTVFVLAVLLPVSMSDGAAAFDRGRIQKVISEGEAYEASGKAGMPEWAGGDEAKHAKVMGRLEEAEGTLAEYLSNDPDNADALLLKFRILRLKYILQPVQFSSDGSGTGFVTNADELPWEQMNGTLNRVLELDDSNAEAHYWAARASGMLRFTLVDGMPQPIPPDLQMAIRHAKRALELSPGQDSYREALALYLVSEKQFGEAKNVMKQARQGKHPMYQLLLDREKFPVPEGAVFYESLTSTYCEMMAAAPDPPAFLGLRFAVYMYPGPYSEIEAFYKRRWPDLYIAETDDSGKESDSDVRTYFTSLDWKGAKLVPGDASMIQESKEPRCGLVIMILGGTTNGMDEQALARLPLKHEGSFTTIMIQNTR